MKFYARSVSKFAGFAMENTTNSEIAQGDTLPASPSGCGCHESHSEKSDLTPAWNVKPNRGESFVRFSACASHLGQGLSPLPDTSPSAPPGPREDVGPS